MKKLITPNTAMLLILVAVIHFHACTTSDAASHPHKHTPKQAAAHNNCNTPQPAASANCNTLTWAHVYDPERLQVPGVCDHVPENGSYVPGSRNGWMEMCTASKIKNV
jgi:hypothetical protein